MRTGFVLAVCVIAAVTLFTVGCGQTEERAETASSSARDVTVTCQGPEGDVNCQVACTGTDEAAEYVVTCDGQECAGEYTVTCDHDGDTATCTITCASGKDVEITCDGKTVTCEHADGSKCTFTHPDVSQGVCTLRVAKADGGMPEGCPGCDASVAGTCPHLKADVHTSESPAACPAHEKKGSETS
jgi:hypothetical protein